MQQTFFVCWWGTYYPKGFPMKNNKTQSGLTTVKPVSFCTPRVLGDVTNPEKTTFTVKEVASALHVDERTLRNWHQQGQKPRRYKDSEHSYYYYKLDELNEFLAEQFYKKDSKKAYKYLQD